MKENKNSDKFFRDQELEGFKKIAEVATNLLLEILHKTKEAGLLDQYPERFKIWYESHKND